MKVLVVGGSGLIGSQVVAQLTELGHEAIPASPRTGVNAITGEGVAEAVTGVHTVVDVSNSPSWADDDVLEFFTTSTRNLLEAERAAGVQHHVALSVVGTDRLAQKRPSDAILAGAKDDYGCDPRYSTASNLGPNNPVLIKNIKQEQQEIAKFDHVKISQIPADAVTTSGSGLDPDISPQNADIQVDRIAAARHVSPAAIMALVKQYTQGRTLGFLGEPRVDVLNLNIALDEKYPVS